MVISGTYFLSSLNKQSGKMAHRYDFPVTPVANPSSVIGGKGCKYRFTVLSSGLIRYEWASDSAFEDRASTFALHRDQPAPKFRLVETDDDLEIVTDRARLYYNKQPFSASGFTLELYGGFHEHGVLWRYGQESPDLGGTAETLDDANGRIALGHGIISKLGIATIDDSESMLFDGKGWVGSRKSGGDRVDGYLFAFGHDYIDAIKTYYTVSGQQPLLPRWALGNWWSRYYAYSADEYLELMDRFREEGLPFSVGVLDMDWHLVDDERVKGNPWTGYSWNKKLFPDPEKFLKELHKRGLKVTANDHPALGIRSFEDQYQDMAKALGHNTQNGNTISFDITDRKFADAFFDILHRQLEVQGIDFWWVDWQQGSHSRIPGMSPLWMLNHFHFLDNKINGERPLTFSRFAGPGSHRYPVGFSGDSHVTWESLDFQPEFTATASNIGYGWWSHDIGGHMHGYRDEELATRWMQYGVFSPIMRLHSASNLFNTKEPWKFGVEARGIMNDFLRLRHQLLPYLYSMNVRASRDSRPVVEPVYWTYPDNEASYIQKNEYMFGSELLVIPITSPQDSKTRLGRVRGWVPPGRHVDIFSGVVYDGNRDIWLNRNLTTLPILAKEGSIIPLNAAEAPQNGGALPEKFKIVVIVGADGTFDILEDDDTGASLKNATFSGFKLMWKQSSGILSILPIKDAAPLLKERAWVVKFVAHKVKEKDVSLNGLRNGNSSFNLHIDDTGSTIIEFGPYSSTEEISLSIGFYPQLAPTDFHKHVYTVLNGAYIAFELKKYIWAVVDADVSLGTKVGQLSSIGLDEVMFNAVLEYLIADHRS
jgi:alpha-glucosidase (family GH31 glycosyl hydrolase)